MIIVDVIQVAHLHCNLTGCFSGPLPIGQMGWEKILAQLKTLLVLNYCQVLHCEQFRKHDHFDLTNRQITPLLRGEGVE